MKRSIEVLLAALVTGLLAYTLGTCAAPSVSDTRQDAYEAERILRRNRNTLQRQQAQTDTITRVVIKADAKLAAERDSLQAVLAYADSVLEDSTASLVTLRVTLGVTIARARQYQAAADSLAGVTRELIAAHALERLAANETLIAAERAVNGWKAQADAERRKGWRRFTQGAFVGGIVTLALVLVL